MVFIEEKSNDAFVVVVTTCTIKVKFRNEHEWLSIEFVSVRFHDISTGTDVNKT